MAPEKSFPHDHNKQGEQEGKSMPYSAEAQRKDSPEDAKAPKYLSYLMAI
jgi:hypothetical protein